MEKISLAPIKSDDEAYDSLLNSLKGVSSISFKSEINNANNINDIKNRVLQYDEALGIVQEYVEKESVQKIKDAEKLSGEKVTKDKAYYRELKANYTEIVRDVVSRTGLKIQGYEDEGGRERFIKEAVSEYIGFSVLEDAMEDPSVSDVFVISYDCIYVESHGKNVKYPKKFRSETAYKIFIDRMLREAGTEINRGDKKIVDFEIYGDRGNAIINDVATRGISLALRKHEESPITLQDIIKYKVMSQEEADFLGTVIEGEMSMIYAGITGSGKTTTIRALLDYYVAKLNKRIFCAEDTQELFLKNEHTVELKTFKSNRQETVIDLTTLIEAALRMKPKYIVVGEVRGKEAASAVEAMETGHSTIFTMHGGTVWNIINRLVTKYLMAMPSLGMDVAERIIGSAVDYVCVQDDIPNIGRRLTSVHELTYDFSTNHIVATPIIEYNFEKKGWDWLNPISEEKGRTMMRRGVPYDRIKPYFEIPKGKFNSDGT